ncbi:MAG: hypothetical protein CMM54_05755 [Rhodospirillaceae bacterium]|nr:hypothetical protein [Rhodospirillaceae bacterium]
MIQNSLTVISSFTQKVGTQKVVATEYAFFLKSELFTNILCHKMRTTLFAVYPPPVNSDDQI